MIGPLGEENIQWSFPGDSLTEEKVGAIRRQESGEPRRCSKAVGRKVRGGDDGAILPRRGRRVGILRRRNAIHKILKFRHVVFLLVANACARMSATTPCISGIACARLVSSPALLSCLLSSSRRLRGEYIFLSPRLLLHFRFQRTTLT